MHQQFIGGPEALDRWTLATRERQRKGTHASGCGGDYEAGKAFQDPFANDFECYYLLNEDHTAAIGWVHNMRAYWENSFYIKSTLQNFLGCTVPSPDPPELHIQGFDGPIQDYQVTWYPTRMNDTEVPEDYEYNSLLGYIPLLFDQDDFNGVVNNYLDTLHSDYAFIITPASSFKNGALAPDGTVSKRPAAWDFSFFPNPTTQQVVVVMPDSAVKDITIHDLSGRCVRAWKNTLGAVQRLPLGQLATGAYALRVSDGLSSKMKTLIIH